MLCVVLRVVCCVKGCVLCCVEGCVLCVVLRVVCCVEGCVVCRQLKSALKTVKYNVSRFMDFNVNTKRKLITSVIKYQYEEEPP